MPISISIEAALAALADADNSELLVILTNKRASLETMLAKVARLQAEISQIETVAGVAKPPMPEVKKLGRGDRAFSKCCELLRENGGEINSDILSNAAGISKSAANNRLGKWTREGRLVRRSLGVYVLPSVSMARPRPLPFPHIANKGKFIVKPKAPSQYSQEEKEELIRLYATRTVPARAFQKKYRTTSSMIHRWAREFGISGSLVDLDKELFAYVDKHGSVNALTFAKTHNRTTGEIALRIRRLVDAGSLVKHGKTYSRP